MNPRPLPALGRRLVLLALVAVAILTAPPTRAGSGDAPPEAAAEPHLAVDLSVFPPRLVPAAAPPGEPTRLDAAFVARVLVRARNDLEGAAGVLRAFGHHPPASPLAPSASVPVWARVGDTAAIGRLLLGAVIEPEIRPWLMVTAARGLAERHPAIALTLARKATASTPGGREALRLSVELLEGAGAAVEAVALVSEHLGVPWDRLGWVSAAMARALPPREDAAAEAERGWLLLDNWSTAAADAAFQRALALEPAEPRVRCMALHGAARAALKLGRTADATARFREARDACPDAPESREAAVYLPRLAFAAGAAEDLAADVAWVVARDPELARREGLTALEALTRADGAIAPLAATVRRRFDRFVSSDPIGDEAMALWRPHFEKGRFAEAAAILGTLVAHEYGSSRQRDWGRLEYWLGRTHQAAGDPERAAAAFARAAEIHPISWYGLRSLEALAALAPERAAEIRTFVDESRLLAAPDAPAPDWAADPDARAAAERVASLQRWGLTEAMEAEVRRAAFERDAGQALWAARMLHAAGGHRAGTRLATRALERLGAWAPNAGFRALWREAWPTPYRGWVEAEAERSSLDPYLVWAVMRIESFYEPTAVSHAGARGLLQLMPDTVQWLRDILPELPPDGDLFDPPENVQLGVRMLERMALQYAGSKPLMLAAYNAGPGRVSRELRRDKREDLDLFVEDFPFEEARNYVRSVLGAWAAYHWLDGCECLVRLDEAR